MRTQPQLLPCRSASSGTYGMCLGYHDMSFPSQFYKKLTTKNIDMGFSGSGTPQPFAQALVNLGTDQTVTDTIGRICTVLLQTPETAPITGAAALWAPLVLDWIAREATIDTDEYDSSFEATWSGRAVDQFYAGDGPGANSLQMPFHAHGPPRRKRASSAVPICTQAAHFRRWTGPCLWCRHISYSGTKARMGNSGHFSAVTTLNIETYGGQ